MDNVVKASAAQFNITLGDIPANQAKAMAALNRLRDRGAELVVLPEMWSTGYDYRQLPQLAEETPRLVEELCRYSATAGQTIVGSMAEKEDDNIFNTAFVIDRGELKGKYRKVHLFSVMREDRYLAAGHKSLVVPTSIGRLGIAICYDLRFPELFRKLALEGAEILCLPAEWPKPRQEHWRTLLRARAIENQMFVIAANCCGIQAKLDFFGMSLLIEPRGEILAEGGETDTELLAEFDFEQMKNYRFQIPCFKDRRPDIYGTLPG
ncbi:MAG: carbon-nitrogen family hydrolase [Desulfuromonas sp.]|nr:MAG: carbon-nitrogen family hydrolase [Desulfuromonas sp.]